jgi:hypothetical protein
MPMACLVILISDIMHFCVAKDSSYTLEVA